MGAGGGGWAEELVLVFGLLKVQAGKVLLSSILQQIPQTKTEKSDQ